MQLSNERFKRSFRKMGKAANNQVETRDRILDTAESLFSDQGFRDVSLRHITREAGVNIAAVNYHFGSKEALVAEVLTRVISPINRERLNLLDQAEAEAKGESISLETILDALHRPVVTQLQQTGHQSSVYLKLAGRCLSEPAENFSDTIVVLFKEVIQRFMAATCKSLPGLDEADIFWRMHFSFGTMIYALTHGDRLALFSQGKVKATDPEDTLQRLIEFTAAGLRANADGPKKGAPSRQRKAGIVASALIALVGLSSCKSISPPDSKHFASVQAPAHWVAGDNYRPDHIADRFWVENFEDSNLTAFVNSVIENNKDLKAAQSRIEIAAANARIVGADIYPQLNGGLNGGRSSQNFIGLPLPGSTPGSIFSSQSNQFGLALDMTWEIDLWGRIRAAESAAVADFEASQFDRATAELSLAGQAAKAWFALAEARDQIALTRSSMKIFSETEALIRSRYEHGIEENGRNFASELLLAESDVARAEENLSSEQDLAERTSRQLEVLAGKYPAGRAGTSARLSPLPPPVPADLPATLLDRRPDLAVAERRIAAADERLLEAKRSLLPALSLTGSYGTSSSDISNILDGGFSVWSIAGNMAQPILQGGRLRANISRKDAELQLAATEFEQVALTAFSEVENALASERYLRKRIQALEKSVRLTGAAYDRSREEFEKGTGDILTVLSSQERAFTTRSQLLTVRRLQLDNRVDLYLALGGSFRPYEAPEEGKDSQS